MIRFSKIEHNVRELIPRLSAYFESLPEVAFAYLFGSYGEGSETPLSDIDIAVYLFDGARENSYFDFRLRMIGDVSHLLKTNEVDVVILNEVTLSLRYQAVSTRQVLFERDPAQRIGFEVRTLNRYLDMHPLIRVQQEYFLRHVKEGLVFG